MAKKKKIVTADEQRQQLLYTQSVRLHEMGEREERARVWAFPLGIALVTIVLLLAYFLTNRHCQIDRFLLIVTVVAAVFLTAVIMYKNRALCQRIERMSEERGQNA